MTMTDVIILGLGLLVADLHLSLPAIARFVVRWRASRLPPPLAERMTEEWLAEIDATPSNLLKLWFALGLFRGIGDLIRADRERPAKEPPRTIVLRAEPGHLYPAGAKAIGTLTNVTPEPVSVELSGVTVSAAVGFLRLHGELRVVNERVTRVEPRSGAARPERLA